MKVSSSFRMISHTEEVKHELIARAKRNVVAATMELRNSLIDTVNQQGTGKKYPIRPETGRLEKVQIVNKLGYKQTVTKLVGAKMHQASSPGAPPAVLRGQLKSSFQYEFEEMDEMYRGYVGPVNVIYAKALEFGFVGKDREGRNHNLQPRPYMAPTWHLKKTEIQEILKRGAR